MDDKIKKYLHDAYNASMNIALFTASQTRSSYGEDLMLKSAVERQFEITGEALNRVKKRMKESLSR